MRKVIAVLTHVDEENTLSVVTDDGLCWEWSNGKWWNLGMKDPDYPEVEIPNETAKVTINK